MRWATRGVEMIISAMVGERCAPVAWGHVAAACWSTAQRTSEGNSGGALVDARGALIGIPTVWVSDRCASSRSISPRPWSK
jgi:hypothetical protein